MTDPQPRAYAAAQLGLPDPLLATGAAMIAGGVALGVNILPRAAAAGLAAALVSTTLLGHPFWQGQDPGPRQARQVHFLKNIGLLGALVALAANPRR